MIASLPRIYHIASISPMDESLRQNRTSALGEIMKTKTLDWFLDCIRYYLQKPTKNRSFEKDFFLSINKFDPLFIDENTAFEKRVLASVIVGECILSHSDKDVIAGAVRTAIFGIPKENIFNYEVVELALDHLHKRSVEIREAESHSIPQLAVPAVGKTTITEIDAVVEFIKKLLKYNSDFASSTKEQFDKLQNKIEVLQEESNIHWWLFRSYSNIKKSAVNEIPAQEAIFILSKELDDLIEQVPAPLNMESFLKKIWNDVSNKQETTSIKDAITILVEKLRIDVPLDEAACEKYGNLAPLHFAYSKAIEAGGEEAWGALFKAQTVLDAATTFEPFTLSCQFLTELILFDL